MNRFIIEHASRGAFVGMNHNGNGDWAPRFRWSILRTDPEVLWWPTREQAERMLATVRRQAPKAYIVPLTMRR